MPRVLLLFLLSEICISHTGNHDTMHKLVRQMLQSQMSNVTETVTEATLRDIYFIRFDLTAPTAP